MPVFISLRIGKISRLIGGLTLLSAVLGPPAASAQITAATIGGVITDETGGALSGVEVTIKNLATGFARSAVTAGNGSYTIPGLPPGVYDVRATLFGFTTAVHSGIQLTVAEQASLNLTMKVGRSELVVVVGKAGAPHAQRAEAQPAKLWTAAHESIVRRLHRCSGVRDLAAGRF